MNEEKCSYIFLFQEANNSQIIMKNRESFILLILFICAEMDSETYFFIAGVAWFNCSFDTVLKKLTVSIFFQWNIIICQKIQEWDADYFFYCGNQINSFNWQVASYHRLSIEYPWASLNKESLFIVAAPNGN